MDYKRKIDFAINLLRNIPTDSGPIEVSYSGGKDSDVILELAKMSGIDFRAIYKQTTIDPPGTTAHVKEMGVEIVRPKLTFFQLIEKKGIPSRYRRFCCTILKEYKILDRSIQGIRRSESTKRAARYKEPEECRLYENGSKVRVYYPILEWTNEDVERFIQERGIKCAPAYYDEEGKFHVERRLGCIGCPLKSDIGLADFTRYPKMLKAEIRAFQKYLDAHPNSNYWKMIDGRAEVGLFYVLFCRSTEEFMSRKTGGLFPDDALDIKKYMEDYFKIKL